MHPFQELLSTDRILVVDGAMGTMLYAKGVYINRCYDELNLSSPDLVAEIPTEYIRAGAAHIETNPHRAPLRPPTPSNMVSKQTCTRSTLAPRRSRAKPPAIAPT